MIIPDEFLKLDSWEITALLSLQITEGLHRAIQFFKFKTGEEMSVKGAEWILNQEAHTLVTSLSDLREEIYEQLCKQR